MLRSFLLLVKYEPGWESACSRATEFQSVNNQILSPSFYIGAEILTLFRIDLPRRTWDERCIDDRRHTAHVRSVAGYAEPGHLLTY